MTTTRHTPAQRLVLGAMTFGTTVDEATAFDLLDRFVDAGGRWIDTADCYAFWASESGYGGQSEEVLGRWLAARLGVRDRVLLSTKFGAEPRRRQRSPRRGRSGPPCGPRPGRRGRSRGGAGCR